MDVEQYLLFQQDTWEEALQANLAKPRPLSKLPRGIPILPHPQSKCNASVTWLREACEGKTEGGTGTPQDQPETR